MLAPINGFFPTANTVQIFDPTSDTAPYNCPTPDPKKTGRHPTLNLLTAKKVDLRFSKIKLKDKFLQRFILNEKCIFFPSIDIN